MDTKNRLFRRELQRAARHLQSCCLFQFRSSVIFHSDLMQVERLEPAMKHRCSVFQHTNLLMLATAQQANAVGINCGPPHPPPANPPK